MYLQGPRIRLETFKRDHGPLLETFYKYQDDVGMWRHMSQNLTPEQWSNYPAVINGEVFIIYQNDNDKPLGVVLLIPDHKLNRGFYFGIMLVREARNQRIPTEACYLLLDYAFNRRGYNKAIMEVLEDNKSLCKTMEVTGFIKEGTLLKEAFVNGHFVNEVRYCMFASHFRKHAKDELGKVAL